MFGIEECVEDERNRVARIYIYPTFNYKVNIIRKKKKKKV